MLGVITGPVAPGSDGTCAAGSGDSPPWSERVMIPRRAVEFCSFRSVSGGRLFPLVAEQQNPGRTFDGRRSRTLQLDEETRSTARSGAALRRPSPPESWPGRVVLAFGRVKPQCLCVAGPDHIDNNCRPEQRRQPEFRLGDVPNARAAVFTSRWMPWRINHSLKPGEAQPPEFRLSRERPGSRRD